MNVQKTDNEGIVDQTRKEDAGLAPSVRLQQHLTLLNKGQASSVEGKP
jgi:hypothetical protein